MEPYLIMFKSSLWNSEKCTVWLFNNKYLYHTYYIIPNYLCFTQSGTIINGYKIVILNNGIEIVYAL